MSAISAMPVVVELPPEMAAEVRSFLETECGWQVVSRDGGLRPRLAVAERVIEDIPTVLVRPGGVDSGILRDGLLAGAVDVLGWPGDRAQLPAVAQRLPAVGATGAPPVLAVGGAAGGVGTSTVALALAGLLAWSGRTVVVVGGPGTVELCGLGTWSGPSAAEVALLAPPDRPEEIAALSRPVPGVHGLRVLAGDPADADVAGWAVDRVVVDAGTAGRHRSGVVPDLLVARPDASLRAAVTWDGVGTVIVGSGPLTDRVVRRLLPGRVLVRLPHSVRVARAGVAGRVPAGLPGSFLAPLRVLLKEGR